ncbi:FTR1 family protein [Dactylosporangium sp. NPDC005555]|uniref:FTR1 family protein n=1 Tax=Dactylosporangium sp. NPDC005555 TaxID=3154889 RepID=UPI0033B22A08
MGTVFVAGYAAGLRLGLGVTLVVGLLVAVLSQTSRPCTMQPVRAGVAAAAIVAAGLGALLTAAGGRPGGDAPTHLFEAVTALASVTSITWLIFWMRRTLRMLHGEPTGRLERMLTMGGWTVAATAFLAVLRKGTATALLVLTADSAGRLAAMLLGIATSVGLGWIVTTAATRIGPGRLLAWAGAALILVAAGILKDAVHGLQIAGVLYGPDRLAFDLTAGIDPASWYATLLVGTVNLTPRATALEITSWLAFATLMLGLYFGPAADPAQGSDRDAIE